MHSLHILLLGFNKKDADKLQKKLGNSFTLIRADENINLKKNKVNFTTAARRRYL